MHLYSTPPEAVRCPRCLKWWKPGNVSCAVVHMGDGCCHYGDAEVTLTGSPVPPQAPRVDITGPGTSNEVTHAIANRIGSISGILTA